MASVGHLSTSDGFLTHHSGVVFAADSHGRCAPALASSRTANNNNDDRKDIVSTPSSASKKQNLYEVLGARPSDSQITLRSRYTTLARELHPDAPGGDPTRFSEVAAAWAVLGDKQSRLRYDRSLQASEFAEGFAHALEVGFKTAIPFLQNTASTTVHAVDATSTAMKKTAEVTSQTVKDVSGTLERARGRLALEQKKKSLEQKATQEANQAKRLDAERQAIVSGDQSARLPELAEGGARLSPSDAARILQKLGESSASAPQLYREIEMLKNYFDISAEKSKMEDEVKAAVAAAAMEKEEAVSREAMAVQKLEEARKELEAACASSPVPAPNTRIVLPTMSSSRRAYISRAARIDPGHMTTPKGSPIFSLSASPDDHHSSTVVAGFSTSHIVTDNSSSSIAFLAFGLARTASASSATPSFAEGGGTGMPSGTVRDMMGSLPFSLALRLPSLSAGAAASFG